LGPVVVVTCSLLAAACPKDDKGTAGGKDDGKAADDGKPADDDAAADAAGADETATPAAGGSSSGPAAADTGAAADSTGAATPTAETGAAAADEAGDAGADDTAAEVDSNALLKEVKAKKTKDDRALAALAEAEAAGAKPRDVAKAANARGLALHGTPDRAKVFFEWALEKDDKYPDPAFNLAKQAVVLGEVAETVKWLTETKTRGGKKLVKQVEFDPMWEIVKDDPEVRALLK
jgi:hypothetical protein